MKTFPFGEGVPPGTYKVTLAPQLAARLNRPRYSTPEQTPWRIEVSETDLRDQVFEVE